MKWVISSLFLTVAALFFQPLTVTVVIPCYYKHACCLPELLRAYEAQTRRPDEVVISLSEPGRVAPELIAQFERGPWAFPVKVLLHEEKLSAGANRNRACEDATGAVILFQDADDIPHPQRVEVVCHFFEEDKVDFLVHSFVYSEDPLPQNYDATQVAHTPYEKDTSEKVSYGSIALSRRAARCIHWRSTFGPGEDLDFMHRVFHKFPHGLIVDAALLTYRNELSSFRQ